MDIFKGLFRNFFRSNQPGRNYEDKTPYKIQVMRKALTGMNVECAGELLLLSCDYNIKWEQVSCLKGIRLEDVTPELDSKAYAELKNNKH